MISEQQRRKINELQPFARWAAEQIVLEAQKRGYDVVFQEVYRTQSRQNELFCKGRTTKEIVRLHNYGYITYEQRNTLLEIYREKPWLTEERIVTWTLRSKHTKRLAADIKPVNFGFDELQEIAIMFGVTQPIPHDQWHHEFQGAIIKPLSLSIEAKIKSLQRGIQRSTGHIKKMLERQFERLRQRLR